MVPKFDELWYTRPKGERSPSIHSYNSSQYSSRSGSSTGIPDGLQLQLVLSGNTCPPCSLRDFNDYLDHVEHSAENLAFYMWLKDYKKRFFEMPLDLQELSPKPNFEAIDAPKRVPKLAVRGRPNAYPVALTTVPIIITPPEECHEGSKESLRSSDEKTITAPVPGIPNIDVTSWEEKVKKMEARSPIGRSDSLSTDTNDRSSIDAARQPFRNEIDSMIVTFLTSSGSKELNLPSQLRIRTIQAARESTHPDVFGPVNDHVWNLLLYSSHPNFIRYVISNGNAPRVWCAHFLGALFILLGLLEALLCIGYDLHRGWRVFSVPLFLMGAATLAAAAYGMCVVLHGLHHRQLRPWELFRDEETGEYAPAKRRRLRIFDKEVWVEEPVLRQLHDRIFFQALAVSALFTCVMEAIFLSVPNAPR